MQLLVAVAAAVQAPKVLAGSTFLHAGGVGAIVVNARRCQSFVARIRETETEGSKPFANVGCIDGGPPIEAKRVLKKSCTTRHPVSHMGVPLEPLQVRLGHVRQRTT